jgi:hypothetical protein
MRSTVFFFLHFRVSKEDIICSGISFAEARLVFLFQFEVKTKLASAKDIPLQIISFFEVLKCKKK